MAAEPTPPVKTRPPPRKVAVVKREAVTPRLLRLTLGGPALAGFGPARPTAHIKLLFGDLPEGWTPGSPGPRPTARTYTPRRFDPGTQTLEVEFLRHGAGVASAWAERAKVGDSIFVAGPGGGLDIPPDLTRAVLFADETALPAAGMLIEALPQGCAIDLYAEVENAKEERAISPVRTAAMHWLHRATTSAAPSALLEKALADRLPANNAFVWIACEASTMRRMRAGLMQRGHEKRYLVTRGYWKLGQSDYPDGDYGE